MVTASLLVLGKMVTPRRHRDPDYARSIAAQLYGGRLRAEPGLPFVRQPTLILVGTDDPIIPLVNARIMARLLREPRLHTYDDGHLGLVTEANELAPVVTDFLLTNRPGDSS